MPRLLTIRTDLSEYRTAQYGYDRRGAGPRDTNASGQPYEIIRLRQRNFNETDFNASTELSAGQVEDFLLRGGALLPETALRDVSRLTKMFTDLKSPNGLLFTAKQEALSRSGVNVLAAGENEFFATGAQNNRAFNNGIYLPTSTILQAAGVGIGTHLLKQGIDPTADTDGDGGLFNLLGFDDPLANPLYFNTIAYQERKDPNNVTSRLVDFARFNIDSSDNDSGILYSYSGGPGSVLGVTGKTNINMPTDGRTGRNNASLTNSGFFTTGVSESSNFGFDYSVFGKKVFSQSPSDEVEDGVPFNFRGGTYFGNINSDLKKIKSVSRYYQSIVKGITTVGGAYLDAFKTTNDDVNGSRISDVGQSVNQPGTFTPNPSVPDQPGLTYDELLAAGDATGAGAKGGGKLMDFRGLYDYGSRDKTLPGKYNTGDPGRDDKANKNALTFGNAGAADFNSALDKVNAYPIYTTKNPSGIGLVQDATFNGKQKDLCKFRIGVINNNDPSFTTYLHFRAFIDGMSDNYSAEWNETRYMGRAESFYNYNGFSREFSLDWTVAAQSKGELLQMYKKLNYLASVCAPDYSENGYMRGNLIKLTIGDYLFEQPGFFSGISFSPPQESPWEIAVNAQGGEDGFVKQLPFIMKVTGFKFTPIHTFVPQIQKNSFGTLFDVPSGTNQEPGDAQTAATENGTPLEEAILTKYGPQRYIALGNNIPGAKNNFDFVTTERPKPVSVVQSSGITVVTGSAITGIDDLVIRRPVLVAQTAATPVIEDSSVVSAG